MIKCTHSISSTTPDQENTAIFRIQQIRVQGKPYRTWPVPRALSTSGYVLEKKNWALALSPPRWLKRAIKKLFVACTIDPVLIILSAQSCAKTFVLQPKANTSASLREGSLGTGQGSLGTGQRFHYQLYTFNLKYNTRSRKHRYLSNSADKGTKHALSNLACPQGSARDQDKNQIASSFAQKNE